MTIRDRTIAPILNPDELRDLAASRSATDAAAFRVGVQGGDYA